ncbi:four helix bundle protein [candidate division WOR-3 bacterium]|nr:four helix bundle protein [candidate division WOR-3 bacterium]
MQDPYQISNFKVQIYGVKQKVDQREIANRFLDLAVGIIRISEKISKSPVGRHIASQITRSVTSAGANYQETCGAESRKDFIHKFQVVLKELRESAYWMKLIIRAELIPPEVSCPLMNEVEELTKIIAKSVVTAKSKGKI